MHIVALRTLPAPEPATAQALGAALGSTAYEARARLVVPGGGPVVIANFADAAAAEELAGRLRAAQFDPFTLDTQTMPTDRTRFLARGIHLGDAPRFTHRGGAERTIAWTDIRLILRATGIDVGERIETESSRKFSAGRALISGGLLLTKKSVQTTSHRTEDWQAFLAIYTVGGPPIIVREDDTLFEGPGQPAQPTRQAAFMHILQRLRAAAPSARYDDRLMRRGGQLQLLGRTLTPEQHLDVALAVLARALLGR